MSDGRLTCVHCGFCCRQLPCGWREPTAEAFQNTFSDRPLSRLWWWVGRGSTRRALAELLLRGVPQRVQLDLAAGSRPRRADQRQGAARPGRPSQCLRFLHPSSTTAPGSCSRRFGSTRKSAQPCKAVVGIVTRRMTCDTEKCQAVFCRSNRSLICDGTTNPELFHPEHGLRSSSRPAGRRITNAWVCSDGGRLCVLLVQVRNARRVAGSISNRSRFGIIDCASTAAGCLEGWLHCSYEGHPRLIARVYPCPRRGGHAASARLDTVRPGRANHAVVPFAGLALIGVPSWRT